MISAETLSVPLDSLKRQRQGLFDDLVIAKLMKYYGFEKKEDLMKFLDSEHIQY